LLARGGDLTIVSWSAAVPKVMEAAAMLAEKGVNADVIDLRSLWPWDEAAVITSVERTKRLLVVHEAVEVGGFGAEIVARVIDRLGPANLEAVRRLGAPRLPVPFSPALEDLVRVTSDKIVKAAQAVITPPAPSLAAADRAGPRTRR
jgi:pyruvate dehydrogenase E1 component beta subunit